MNAVRQFLARVKRAGKQRPGIVRVTAMGRPRTFRAWDVKDDTFIFEDGIVRHLSERPSVLIVSKSDLGRRRSGRILTISTGNHSVAAFPLLDRRFWGFSHLPPSQRGAVLMRDILCANVVNGTLETSQRDVSVASLVAADEWLLGTCRFALTGVVMGERNDETLAHYRRRGQEWRVKPMVWTDIGMRAALAGARKRIATDIAYYHSARGVHFLTFPEFMRLANRAKSDYDAFVAGLRELVSVYEGNRVSFLRMPKYRGHHEIELFGLQRGIASERLIPALERLMEAIALGRIGRLGVLQSIHETAELYRSLLARPEMADETSPAFVSTLYMYVTGEIYAVVGEGSTPAFDDRRTALPGATFVDGRIVMHPGADERSEVLLTNLRHLMSKDECVEYANVYELRSGDGEETRLGAGHTREVVYKSNRMPLEMSLIEKRLSSAKKGYGSYMFARVGAMRALGISMSAKYLLLRRRPHTGGRPVDFFIRHRCPGEPMDAIPKSYFRCADGASGEDREVVLALAQLMGDAAAQNMAMKKYDAKTESPLFGVGKEIYEFEYDAVRRRVVPKNVRTCSIRGSFGWPDLSHTEANLDALARFYLGHYAHALKAFQLQHDVAMGELAARFMDGFENRTHALAWKLSVMRDGFGAYAPSDLPRAFDFAGKWRFVMWSLERQESRLPALRQMFYRRVK